MSLFSSPISSPSVSSPVSPLSSPSSPSLPYSATNPKLPPLIVALLQKRVIPEAEALGSMGNEGGNAVLDARMGVARVVLSVMCLGLDSSEDIKGSGSPTQGDNVFSGFGPKADTDTKSLVMWAVGVLCQWHKAGDDLPWRSVLEKSLLQIVS